MKYAFNLSNVKFGEGKMQFSLENIKVETEFSVEELKAQYEFGLGLVNVIKEAVVEIAPIVSAEMEKEQRIRHSHAMERIQAEREAEVEKQQNWRERSKVHAQS